MLYSEEMLKDACDLNDVTFTLEQTNLFLYNCYCNSNDLWLINS